MIRRLLLGCALALWAGAAAAQPAKAASASASDCGVALAYVTVNRPVTVTCRRLQADLAPIARQLDALRVSQKLTGKEMAGLVAAMNGLVVNVLASQAQLEAKIDGLPAQMLEQMRGLLKGVADGTKTPVEASNEARQWKAKYDGLLDRLQQAAKLSKQLKALLATSHSAEQASPELVATSARLDEVLKGFDQVDTGSATGPKPVFNDLVLTDPQREIVAQAQSANAQAIALTAITVMVPNIAERLLTPKALQTVAALLDGRSLASYEVAGWADQERLKPAGLQRFKRNWQYVSIPAAQEKYDAMRDCPATGCLVSALTEQIARLKNPSQPAAARAEALKMLVALVTDAHRVMHTIDRNDRGGNAVKVKVPGQALEMTLHTVWDTTLMQGNLRGRKPEDHALAVLTSGRASLTAYAAAVEPVDWVNETHAIAQQHAYAGIPETLGPGRVQPLTESYMLAGRQIVDRQLLAAGVRLAEVLNSAFQ